MVSKLLHQIFPLSPFSRDRCYNRLISYPNTGYSEPPGIDFLCPDNDTNTVGRVAAVTHENVQSWEACSQKCQEMWQKMEGCKYWTWHHGNAPPKWRYKCMTMIDASGKTGNTNTVSGRRDCV